MKQAIPPKVPFHTDDRYWCLLKNDDGALYLLVHVEKSFVGYPALIKLNTTDLRNYHALGWLAIQYLGHHLNSFTEEYASRFIDGPLLEAALKAAPST